MTKRILSLIPEHEVYVEVFCGSAKVLLAKPRSPFEVMNDMNGDLTNFFRVCKHRAAELAERLEQEIVSAERFRELRKSGPDHPRCEIERALCFYYLAAYSFGGLGEHYAGNSAANRKPKRTLEALREVLRSAADRLTRVQIEQRDCLEILGRYDSPDTFFYLDPPYIGFQDNGRYEELAPEKRSALYERLASIKGKFLLSFCDHPEVRAAAEAHGWCVQSVHVPYSIAGPRRAAPATEVLVANYHLQDCV